MNLKTKDVDFQTEKIHIKHGKGDKDRIVWLNEEALEVLREWREIKPESELLFTTLKGGPINPRYVREMVRRKGEQAGINKNAHPHMLRHSFATDLYRESKNLRLVQKALEHSSISTTEVYTYIVDEELEREMKFFCSKEVV